MKIKNLLDAKEQIKLEYPAIILVFEEANLIYAFDDDAIAISKETGSDIFCVSGTTAVIGQASEKEMLIARMISRGYRIALCQPKEMKS